MHKLFGAVWERLKSQFCEEHLWWWMLDPIWFNWIIFPHFRAPNKQVSDVLEKSKSMLLPIWVRLTGLSCFQVFWLQDPFLGQRATSSLLGSSNGKECMKEGTTTTGNSNPIPWQIYALCSDYTLAKQITSQENRQKHMKTLKIQARSL